MGESSEEGHQEEQKDGNPDTEVAVQGGTDAATRESMGEPEEKSVNDEKDADSKAAGDEKDTDEKTVKDEEDTDSKAVEDEKDTDSKAVDAPVDTVKETKIDLVEMKKEDTVMEEKVDDTAQKDTESNPDGKGDRENGDSAFKEDNAPAEAPDSTKPFEEVKDAKPEPPDESMEDNMEPKSELVAAAEEDAKNNKDQPAPSETAVRPNNRDVLFGRGKPFQNHPGNRKMLSYIDQYKRQYNESPRDQKRPIVEEIIGILTSDGGRFLRRYNEDVNSTWWTEVPKQVAFDKVSHAFRSRGRPKASDSAAAKASLAQARAAAAAVGAHHHHHPQSHLPHHPSALPYPPPHPPHHHHPGQYPNAAAAAAAAAAGHFGGQFGQYGMPPGNFNPMIAAMQQQHHHNPMVGYHPMPGGMTPQQQAMMQAGMMVAMQQQQQGAAPGVPPHPPPPYYHPQQPPGNPYYGQLPPPQQLQQQAQTHPSTTGEGNPVGPAPSGITIYPAGAGGFVVPQQQSTQLNGVAPSGPPAEAPGGASTGLAPAPTPTTNETQARSGTTGDGTGRSGGDIVA